MRIYLLRIIQDQDISRRIRSEKLYVIFKTDKVGSDLRQTVSVILEEAVIKRREQGDQRTEDINNKERYDEDISPF